MTPARLLQPWEDGQSGHEGEVGHGKLVPAGCGEPTVYPSRVLAYLRTDGMDFAAQRLQR